MRLRSLSVEPVGDAELVDRLFRRDEAALREVIARYGDVVYGMARRVVVDASLAEEVAQDTFVAFWRRPGAFDPTRGTVQSFLLGVARNKAIDLVRKEQGRRKTKDLLLQEAEMTMRSTEDDSMRAADERRDVLDALQALSPAQREAIVLAYFGGRTYREVAEELNIPEGTAKTRLRDALIKLRTGLQKSREVGG